MMNRILVAVGVLTVGVALTQVAEAKAKRPTVCFAFTEQTMLVDGEGQKVAVCQDGKKPVILTSYIVTTVKNDDGASVKAAIGYR